MPCGAFIEAMGAQKRAVSEVDTAGEEEEEQKHNLTDSKSATATIAALDQFSEPADDSLIPQPSPKKVKTTKSPSKSKKGGSSSSTTDNKNLKKEGEASSAPPTPVKGAGGGAKGPWSQADNWAILEKVIQSASPDWERIARDMGKSRSQVYDQWRKSLYPELKARYGQ